MSWTAEERETVVTTDDSSNIVYIWTAQQRYINRLKKDSAFELAGEGPGWAEFTIPADRWSPVGVRRTRKVSEKSKREAAARLAARRA